MSKSVNQCPRGLATSLPLARRPGMPSGTGRLEVMQAIHAYYAYSGHCGPSGLKRKYEALPLLSAFPGDGLLRFYLAD
jgi:hypothetical protein